MMFKWVNKKNDNIFLIKMRTIMLMGKRSCQWRGNTLKASFSKSPFDSKPISEPTDDSSAGYAVSRNVGLSRFLSKVYNWTGLAVGGALLSSQVALAMATPATMGVITIGGLVCGIGGLIGSSFMKPEYYKDYVDIDGKRVEINATRNSPMRRALFGLGVLGLGASSASLMAIAAAVNPTAIPMAFGMSMALFGGASLAAYKMPKDKMLTYSRPLMGSLIGLIALQLGGLLATMVIGPNPFSMMIMRVDAYFAVGLFTALIAYDTHVAIKSYEEGMADHLGISVQLFLDFWNIFQSLIRIFSRE